MSHYTVDWNPGVRDFLERIGAHQDVIAFIESQDDPKLQGKLANEVRKRPDITLEEIEATFSSLPKKRTLNDQEMDILRALRQVVRGDALPGGGYKWHLTEVGEWMSIQLMKHRHRPVQTPTEWLDAHELVLDVEETENLFLHIRDWVTHTRPNLASFDLDRAVRASDEWHRAQAGKGKGLVYDGTGEIIHEWDDGWSVRTVTSPNDLKVEGSLMQNCVASYASAVAAGTSRIFSLRDPNNQPHATIELDGGKDAVKQIQGKQNKKPIKEYRERVGEWLQAMGAFKLIVGGYGENDITFRIWESYDLAEAGYAINDYYSQGDSYGDYGEDEEYGVPLVEEIEWDDPNLVLDSVIDKYDRNLKSASDPKQGRHRDYHLRRLANLDVEWADDLAGALVHMCERGEIGETPTEEAIAHRKIQLFEEAAKRYYALYQIEDETGYWPDSDWVDAYYAELGTKVPDEELYGPNFLVRHDRLPEDYFIWAARQVKGSPILMLCRDVIEKLGYPVFPVDTDRDVPGQGLLFDTGEEA